MKQKPLTDVEIFQLAYISEKDIEKAIKTAHPTLAPFLKAEERGKKAIISLPLPSAFFLLPSNNTTTTQDYMGKSLAYII